METNEADDTIYKFKTFEETMDIHKKLFKILKDNGVVRYSDLLLILNPDEKDIKKEYYNFGWYNLYYAKVECNKEGEWQLVLPNAVLLKYKYKKGE